MNFKGGRVHDDLATPHNLGSDPSEPSGALDGTAAASSQFYHSLGFERILGFCVWVCQNVSSETSHFCTCVYTIRVSSSLLSLSLSLQGHAMSLMQKSRRASRDVRAADIFFLSQDAVFSMCLIESMSSVVASNLKCSVYSPGVGNKPPA